MTIAELVAPPRDVLERVRAAVEPPLRAALAGLPDETREVAEFALRQQDFSTAALVLLSAGAVGGTADVTGVATALELAALHERLHSDLMAQEASARAEFGRGRVVAAADALLCLAFARLSKPWVMILNIALLSVVDGCVQEIEMDERDDVDMAGYLGVAAAKHSALTAAACEIGALAAGASRSRAGHLREFGDDIGLARKHVDDVLALHDDLAHRRRGLPVVAAMVAGVDVHGGASPRERASLAEDGRKWCEQQAGLLLARGLGHLRQAALGEAEELAGLAEAVTTARCTPVVPPQPTGD
ncbi:polyprenyl synthetase family protein [Lentzea sp.]|uniref:polyprenyl synthetase family protein n=1 Tax=Lentzea sp. TaxID=56099 RepID=UPI002C098966|nr:polyprenyl synthetase family protein [Lentzea sp.]HUQ61183.1 polyprenyl synthetase family protein [Lentzea sp.]